MIDGHEGPRPRGGNPPPSIKAAGDRVRSDESLDGDPEHPLTARKSTLPLVRVLVSLTVVVVIFVGVLPRIADFSQVWATLVDLTWLEAFTLSLAAGWNLVTYWILVMVTLPGLSFSQAAVVTQTSTAVANILPGGQAFGLGVAYSMYASWGFRRSTIASSLVVSGVADLFAKLSMPVIALVALALGGHTNAALVTAAVIGAVFLGAGVSLFALALKSERSAQLVGEGLGAVASWFLRLVGRGPTMAWADGAARWRAETVNLLSGRWWKVIGAAFLSHASLFLVLLIALRHVGVPAEEVSWAEALGAFAIARLLTALPITPGGLGVIELGLTGALVVAGGQEVPVVAAVLIFRALTYLVQIPFGALTYLLWQHKRSWRVAETRVPE
ncbi:MAG: lysylphosphatidylglycerol synthase transmembrane domain-containing protein [Actinomycetota bacterium]